MVSFLQSDTLTGAWIFSCMLFVIISQQGNTFLIMILLLFILFFPSRWIASQQKSPPATGDNFNAGDVMGRSPSFRDGEKQVFGCEHYKRNCKLRAACCGKLFTCRFCHDEVSDHLMDR